VNDFHDFGEDSVDALINDLLESGPCCVLIKVWQEAIVHLLEDCEVVTRWEVLYLSVDHQRDQVQKVQPVFPQLNEPVRRKSLERLVVGVALPAHARDHGLVDSDFGHEKIFVRRVFT